MLTVGMHANSKTTVYIEQLFHERALDNELFIRYRDFISSYTKPGNQCKKKLTIFVFLCRILKFVNKLGSLTIVSC